MKLYCHFFRNISNICGFFWLNNIYFVGRQPASSTAFTTPGLRRSPRLPPPPPTDVEVSTATTRAGPPSTSSSQPPAGRRSNRVQHPQEVEISTQFQDQPWKVLMALLWLHFRRLSPSSPEVSRFFSLFPTSEALNRVSWLDLMDEFAIPENEAQAFTSISFDFHNHPDHFTPPFSFPQWPLSGLGVPPYVQSVFKRICYP